MNIIETDLLLKLFLPLQNIVLDTIFVFVTMLFDNGYLPIAVSVILLCIPKYRKTGVRILLALLIGLIIGNLILKPLITRIRPFEYTNISLLIPKPEDYSFPSGHTQAAFAFAASIYISHKKAGIFTYILAVLVGLSRMYLMVHYPTDILSGMLLGICNGYIAEHVIQKISIKFRKNI